MHEGVYYVVVRKEESEGDQKKEGRERGKEKEDMSEIRMGREGRKKGGG